MTSSVETSVALIGFMGSGKSTTGAVLSVRLGVPLIETDKVAVERSGRSSIAEIFAVDGEARFRALESEIAKSFLTLPPSIIATGGGFVINGDNVEFLRKMRCKLIYLYAPFATILTRLATATDRPLFKDKSAAQSLYESRQSIYQSIADYVVQIEDKTPVKIAQEIHTYLLSSSTTTGRNSGAWKSDAKV